MFEIGSNNLTTAGTVIDRKVDHLPSVVLHLNVDINIIFCVIRSPRQALGSYCQLLWRFRQPPSHEEGAPGPRAIRLILLRVRRGTMKVT